jgi:hypothetical protein
MHTAVARHCDDVGKLSIANAGVDDLGIKSDDSPIETLTSYGSLKAFSFILSSKIHLRPASESLFR